jgi:hypothetical protein
MDIEGNSNQDLKTLISLDDRLQSLMEQILEASEELKELESLKQEQDEEIDRLKLEADKNQQLMKENVECEPEDENSSRFEFIGKFSDKERAKVNFFFKKHLIKIFNEFGWEREKIIIEKALSKKKKENIIALRCPACTKPISVTELRHRKLSYTVLRASLFQGHVRTQHPISSEPLQFIGEFSDSERAKVIKFINKQIVKIFNELGYVKEKIVIERRWNRNKKTDAKIALRCPACNKSISIKEIQNHIKRKHPISSDTKIIKPLKRSEHYEVNPDRQSSLEDIKKVNVRFLCVLNKLGWNEDTSHIHFKDITTEQGKYPTIEASCPHMSCKMKIELKMYPKSVINMYILKAHLNIYHPTDQSTEKEEQIVEL